MYTASSIRPARSRDGEIIDWRGTVLAGGSHETHRNELTTFWKPSAKPYASAVRRALRICTTSLGQGQRGARLRSRSPSWKERATGSISHLTPTSNGRKPTRVMALRAKVSAGTTWFPRHITVSIRRKVLKRSQPYLRSHRRGARRYCQPTGRRGVLVMDEADVRRVLAPSC